MQVDEVPEALLATITAIGALFLLIGVNGRRVIRFAAAGASFDTATAADQGRRAEKAVESKVAAPASAPSEATQVRLQDVGVRASDELVAELARVDAYRSAVETATDVKRPLSDLELNAIGDAALDHAAGQVYEQQVLSPFSALLTPDTFGSCPATHIGVLMDVPTGSTWHSCETRIVVSFRSRQLGPLALSRGSNGSWMRCVRLWPI